MPAMNCDKCGTEIHFKDDERGKVVRCEQCGESLRLPTIETATSKQPKSDRDITPLQSLVGLAVLGLLVFICCGLCSGTALFDNAPSADPIASQFSGWDGSHPAVVDGVKARMDNPSSFEHVNTSYVVVGDSINVAMEYRGTNAFGGVVTNAVVAKLTRAGKLIELVEP